VELKSFDRLYAGAVAIVAGVVDTEFSRKKSASTDYADLRNFLKSA
jgi:hypothetical protein